MGNSPIDLVGKGGWEHGFIAVRPPATNRPGARLASGAVRGHVSEGTHTRRMSASIARRSGGSSRVGARLTMSEAANRASQKLSGRRASDFQHLAAARLHSAAARQGGISAEAKAHHTKYAAMHRGIAGRTPGKGTAGERAKAAAPSKPPEKLLPGEANARQAAKNIQARRNVFTAGPHAAHAARQKTPVLKALHANTAPGGKYPDAKMHAAAASELGKRGESVSAPSGPSKSALAGARGTKPSPPSQTPAGSHAAPIGPSMGTLGKAAKTSGVRLPGGKAALTTRGRAQAFQAGHALPPPSKGAPHGYPVTDATSWENARKAVGRVKSPARREALRQLLRRTASQYGKTKALKASWAASNTGPALEFAVAEQTFPITGPLDLLISRDPEDGSAVVRHRRGGGEIGRIRHSDDGQWRMTREGKEGEAHTRQRGALLELIGAHNHAAPSPYRRQQPAPAAEPVPQRAAQTPLMQAYGIPAINPSLSTELAASTPVTGASDGPRVTTGLGQRGQTIYKKLRGRGFPHARAHSFARRAERKASG
jgi:hypothetical protein